MDFIIKKIKMSTIRNTKKEITKEREKSRKKTLNFELKIKKLKSKNCAGGIFSGEIGFNHKFILICLNLINFCWKYYCHMVKLHLKCLGHNPK